MSVSIFLLVALVCTYAWLRSRRAAKLAGSAPTLLGCLPLIGHAHKVLGIRDSVGVVNLVKEFSMETNAKGGVTKGWFGPLLFYVVTDPEDALTLLNTCLKKHYFYRFGEPFIGEGLIVARNVSTWKRHRKLLAPAFNQHILDGFLGVFNHQSRYLTERMAKEVDNGPFDHWPYLSANALETICRTALGVPKSGELIGEEYGKACKHMFNNVVKRSIRVWMHWDAVFNWSTLKVEQDEAVKVFEKMTNDVMMQSKQRMKEEEGKDDCKTGRFKAFMDLLVEFGAEGALTDREIREEVDTMIVAGHDTSSTALLFTLFILGSHTQAQERVYDELKGVFGTSDRDVTKEDLPKLVYTEAVLKESLRLYPVGPIVMRYADKDVRLKNCTVAAGSSIITSFWGMHRNACWGTDVEQFRPERWLEGGQCVNGAFGAFSLGRRGCIGKSYAFMSMKTTLAHLLRRYRFSSNYDDIELKLDTVLKIQSGGTVSIGLRLKRVFEGTDRNVTNQDLPRLVYLEAVIKEGLRLYPVIPMISRELHSDVHLKNYTLPSGSNIVISFWGLNRDPKLWGEDVDAFRPERWLNGSLPKILTGGASFGLGKRGCVGKIYAMTSIKTSLAHILRRYKISASKESPKLQMNVALHTTEPVSISVDRR